MPGNLGAFTNDIGYLTGYTESDPTFTAWDKDYNDLTNTPTIPTVPGNLGAFTNDVGYLTGYTENDPTFTAWDKDYNDLTNTPTIPTVPGNLGAFTNDVGYLTGYIETDPIFTNWDKDYVDLTNAPTTITTAQADAIVVNTAKVGITTAQADAIVVNTAKVGITPTQADAIVSNTAKISAIAGTTPGEMQYWNGTDWLTVAPGTKGQVLTFDIGVPTWKPIEGKTDVTNPVTGKIWMDRNLGATQVATSSTDVDAYGFLYQWGRCSDGHQIRTSVTSTVLSSTDNVGHGDFILAPSTPKDWRNPQNSNLWQGVYGVNNPCPTGYRIPTETELNAERASWVFQNSSGAYASPLKLTMAGYRLGNIGVLDGVDSYGAYWSSTVVGSDARTLLFDSGAIMNNFNRSYGFSVRCIKN